MQLGSDVIAKFVVIGVHCSINKVRVLQFVWLMCW